MTRLESSWKIRARCLAISVLMLFTASARAECTDWTVGPQKGTLSSQWVELDESDQSLLLERGNLSTIGLSVSTRCKSTNWTFDFQEAHGQRHYRGLSNKGQTLETNSQIRQKNWGIEADVPIADHWLWGARLQNYRIDRELQSTSQANGYPETFRYWVAETGIQLHQPLAEQLTWTTDAWIGHIPVGRLRVDLPNADPTSLHLGQGHTTEWGMGLTYSPAEATTGWHWSIGWHVRTTTISAGASAPLFRGQRLVGTARQPETHQHSRRLALQAQYRF